MDSSHKHIDIELVNRLRDKYFSNTSNTLELNRGEYLLRQNHKNKRLYLVNDGLIAGFLDSGSGNRQEIFRSEQQMFAGVHSFFSQTFEAYADVVALKKTTLSYIEYDSFTEDERHSIIKDFAPVVVHELSARQLFTKDVMLEKEAALKKLYQSEKYATLGQMAAGLAHELNNAIGVMNGNSEWLAHEIHKYFKDTEIETIFKYFDQGFEHGQTLSSNEVRERKRYLTTKFKLQQNAARKLAKIGCNEKKVGELAKATNIDEIIDRMYYFWEMGVSIHDILLASKHAVHVLKSIKQLSASDQDRSDIYIHDTISEALTLLKNSLRSVSVDYKSGTLPVITANNGELVQVWINIIKNACESMATAKVEYPHLLIETARKRNAISVKISNNGPEIPESIQQKIFQPNFTTKKGGLSFGLGLGLSIVQRIVESYNGKIEVFSNSGNTTFEVKLPIN